MDDCQSFSNKPKWMERQCQSLMRLMARRDIEYREEGRREKHVYQAQPFATVGVKTHS